MTRSCINRKVSIKGTGAYLPKTTVYSDDLDLTLNFPRGTIFKAGGVVSRGFASQEETAAYMGAQAAIKALAAAKLSWKDIDCIVAASGTMDQQLPCNAALIHKELGLSQYKISAFDINASCLSFMVAFDNISWAITSGQYKNVLIVSSDISSCGLDWTCLEASAIFGDGAAAAVIGLSQENEESCILSSSHEVLSEGVDLCKIPGAGTRHHPKRSNMDYLKSVQFQMDGRGVFKLASRHIEKFLDNLLINANIEKNDLDWIIPHQASYLALEHIVKRLGFEKSKVINIFSNHGNQVGASLPTALNHAITSKKLTRGQTALLIGTGAGLAIGGIVFKY